MTRTQLQTLQDLGAVLLITWTPDGHYALITPPNQPKEATLKHLRAALAAVQLTTPTEESVTAPD